MGRPTTNSVGAFDQKQSSAQAHSDTAELHSQLAIIPADRASRPAHKPFTDSKVSMFLPRGDRPRQKRRGRGGAPIRNSRPSRMCNSIHETQSSVHRVDTTEPCPETEFRVKEKPGSGQNGISLMGALFGPLSQPFTATPSQVSYPLPSVISPSNDSQRHLGSRKRADGQPPKSSYRANRLYEPLGPPPSHSSPPKQSSRRSPESGSKAINLSDIYRSGGLPKSHERSSNTESESFDCGSIYGPAKVFPRSEGQPGLSRAVYAARENTRADRNRLEGIENASHRRTGHIMKELAPHPEELDDLSCGILADISVLYHGREHNLPTFDA